MNKEYEQLCIAIADFIKTQSENLSENEYYKFSVMVHFKNKDEITLADPMLALDVSGNFIINGPEEE